MYCGLYMNNKKLKHQNVCCYHNGHLYIGKEKRCLEIISLQQ